MIIVLTFRHKHELEMKTLVKYLQEYKNEKILVNIFLNENSEPNKIRQKIFILQDLLAVYYEINSEIYNI